jgi:predicted RNA-binding protein with PIN domain
MRFIIDAYNVIRTNPEGKLIESRQGNLPARAWLIDLCRAAVRNGEKWIVVFDGDGTATAEQVHGGTLEVRYATPQTADEVVRQLGEDAIALKISARIVSSDGEVRVSGCEHVDSQSFVEFLNRRKVKGDRPKSPSKQALCENILKTLAEKRHIPMDAISYKLKDEVTECISYLFARNLAPQKMAREIEKYLRDLLPLQPNPDPQKEVFRIIKSRIESLSR